MVNLEALADAILRAAGSGLRHYSLPGTRSAILRATEAAVEAGREDVLDHLVVPKIASASQGGGHGG